MRLAVLLLPPLLLLSPARALLLLLPRACRPATPAPPPLAGLQQYAAATGQHLPPFSLLSDEGERGKCVRVCVCVSTISLGPW